ncbi:MAG: DUF559 domain-containing protein [Thaumarchaeota archaeon]|nr:DUF559 domain-containing protein [Nitrososphaerota archaeon]
MFKDDEMILSSDGKERSAKDIREIDDGITRDLESQGYTVLRLWATDLLFDTEKSRQKIVDAVRKSKESLA